MDCIFRFSFVLMEDRRCLYGLRYNSLPLDNVLSQGGGPLAVEGVLLKRDVIYTFPLRPTPSVTCGASSLKREPFGAFPRIGETDFSLPKLYPTTRVSLRNTLRGNPKTYVPHILTPSFSHQHK